MLETKTPEQAKKDLYKEMIENPQSGFSNYMNRLFSHGSEPGVSGDDYLGESGKRYIEKLKEEGYNAIPDFKDNTIAEDPLYVFDRSKSMQYMSTSNWEKYEEKYKAK